LTKASPTCLVKDEAPLAPMRPTAIPWAPHARAPHLLPYLVFLSVGLWCAFYPMLLSTFRRMEVNTGDTRLLNFILEHSYRWFRSWLTFHPISLWDQPIFFPTVNVGAYSDILLGSAPIYWLLRIGRFAPDTAFQLWMVAILILDFVSMALFLRNCLGFGRLPSAVGAFLFAFGSPRLAQLGHQQLLPQFFTMFAVYGLFRFFEPRKMSAKQGIHIFFLCFAAQLWAGFYLGWYLFLGLLVAAIWRCACSGIAGPSCSISGVIEPASRWQGWCSSFSSRRWPTTT